MNKIDIFNKKQLKKIPEIRSGYTVRVNLKIKEGDKERIQAFEGLVIAKKHGQEINATITVRKISHGVGVERIFPLHSPIIASIEVLKKGKVRRAKLYYIRLKSAKESRLKVIKPTRHASQGDAGGEKNKPQETIEEGKEEFNQPIPTEAPEPAKEKELVKEEDKK